MVSPRGRLLAPLLPAGLALALASCSGTRFGDTLSRSFPAPATPPAAPAAPATPATPAKPATTATPAPTLTPNPPAAAAGAGGGSSVPSTPAARSAAAGVPPAAPRPSNPAPAAAPAPYRVTLQLPGADPAAPAEAVTRALRAAGVSFEVETIERLTPGEAQAGSRPGAPSVRPAPTPR